ARVPRIGYLGGDFPELRNAFMNELRARGFVDGENVHIERRLVNDLSEGPAMAKELARLPLDFIVATALPFALMIRSENPDMPMVITTCPGMISNGFARSLEHPGGIYTGLDELPPGVTKKRLTLLRQAVPTAKRVALLSTTPGVGGHEAQLHDAEAAAQSLGLAVQTYRATTAAELDDALETVVRDRVDGLLNFQGGLSVYRRQLIVDFVNANRLPAIYQATLFAEAGGLMSWAPDLAEQQREAARLSAKILKGAKPGDLPVKHPTGYSLTVNSGAARKIGLVLPPALLAQAARVIE
ncbi:MAG TPA: ABC transporter substrate-binding protein, partial [Steroidobacteraceae bacterium]|nr:ABC transporter substrate-binding protein [Steroidobacteraceae bacterium]